MKVEVSTPKVVTRVFVFEKDETDKLIWLLTYLAKPHGPEWSWPEYMLSHRFNGTSVVYIYNITQAMENNLIDLIENSATA